MELEMKYFVLKPKGEDIYATASRAAIQTYANCIANVDWEFAYDLEKWISKERIRNNEKERIKNDEAALMSSFKKGVLLKGD